MTETSLRSRAIQALIVISALLVLNAALTFHNLWPTPAVGWDGSLSLDLALLILGLALARWRRLVPSRGMRRLLAILWLVLALGQYVHVTAPALWGRELNFYWDLRFVPDVASMLARAATPGLVIGVIVGLVTVLVLTYLLLRRSIDVVVRSMESAVWRGVLSALAVIVVVLFIIEPKYQLDDLGNEVPPPVTMPVTLTYAHQVRLVAAGLRGSHDLPPSPPFDQNLAGVQGADVLLLFIESYGAVNFERPEFSSAVAADRAKLVSAIADSGNQVVSAFVESPTFGGSSWFAHISLLSGIQVGDPDVNALLMTAHRDTMPTAFARHGYRTVAMMPGLWYPWPEGAFYGFQDNYNGERLDYRGPPFGWWAMPDQFTLAKLDALELQRGNRAPVFVFYPTVTTHAPFTPKPPYQPDWSRVLTDTPFNESDVTRAYLEVPDWMNLTPNYVRTVSDADETLAGFVREHAKDDVVFIIIGDHQPPALVSGEHASWDVPVHVITKRTAILDSLRARGFRDGITPVRPSFGKMNTLTPVLMDSFSTR